MDAHGKVTMETRQATMEKLAHAHVMCTRTFLLVDSKGLGYKARLILVIEGHIG